MAITQYDEQMAVLGELDGALTWRQWLYERHELVQYILESRPEELKTSYEISRNDWVALNCFDGERGWLNREDFRAMCRKRMDAGEGVYSLVIDGELAAVTFLVFPQRYSNQSSVRKTYEFLPDAAASYGSRVMRNFRSQGLYKALLNAALCDAFDRGARRVYTFCESNNKHSRRAQEKMGFKVVGIDGYRCLGGKVTRWQA